MVILVVVVAIIIFYMGFTLGRVFEERKFNTEINEVHKQIEDLTKYIGQSKETSKKLNDLQLDYVECVEEIVFAATSAGIDLKEELISRLKTQCASIRGIDENEYLFTKKDADEFFG